jgi:hydrogenase-4 membrane subunit HyfE
MLLVGATLACLAIAVTLSSGGHDGIGVGLATVLVGMVAAARRGAVVQALGLLTMQNGMALVALGTERPWLAVAAATPLLPALVLLRRVAPR